MLRRLLLLCLLALIARPALAEDGRKVALIVANGRYANAGALANPPNDGRLIADAARRAGFQTVTLAPDLTLAAFQRALRDFREQASGAQVAMVYYAGHGIEGAGKNWLIPIDASLGSDLDLPYEAIDLDRVMEALSGARVRMVVLDACRNNPFGRSWRSGTRAVTRGLASVEADDVLVIYAAAPGQTASDGTGGNSPFATSLAQRLVQPDLPIQLLGGAVRDDVLASTGGEQRPFVSASITGTPVYLVPRTATAAASAPSPAPSVDNATLDALAWQGAVGANSAEAFEEYKRQFPAGRFVRLADQNIARINQPATTAPPQAPPAQRPVSTTATGDPTGIGQRVIFPMSSNRQLQPDQFAGLTLAELKVARNEIFARHGFIFLSPELRAHFTQFSWYSPVSRQVQLSPIEQRNVQLLLEAERARSGGGH